ncbi:Methyltransferase type 11 [Hyella patelloides LEGE 07179]|uniref:Methyltransferase type 11 n=1 Tax=Hyella patelloides LEGE 07179 TaxID=945734 RepID=A0A563VWU9_9CYAN|nr:class I SAM-dependent methyltransferase [Hyella patelloides]VEP15900.1 Methyltransferase type 11 [Hyella patelloides LEGE 07179]
MTNNFHQQKENFFNLWAPYYDCLLTTGFYQAIHQRLLEYVELKENASVLDLGCGTGKLMSRLAAEFPTVRAIGLDLSPEMLREARVRNQYRKRLIFVSGRAESLSFADEQFDAVFCTMSFLHYPHPQQVFHQVSRVLAPCGRFYLVDGYRGENNFSSFIPWIGEMRLYNQQQREQLGTEAGFSAIAHYYLLPGILLTVFATRTEQS